VSSDYKEVQFQILYLKRLTVAGTASELDRIPF